MANKPLAIIGGIVIIGIGVIANKLFNKSRKTPTSVVGSTPVIGSTFINARDTVDFSSDANGNLYLFINSYIDTSKHIAKIKKINYLTNKVEDITVNQDITNSTGVAAVDPDGKNLYFVRYKNDVVDLCKIDLNNGKVTVINTSSAKPAFVKLTKIVVDNEGKYVYVTDTTNPKLKGMPTNNLVRKIDISTGNVTNLGTRASPAFNNPMDVAIDNKGNVYVADERNNLVRKIDKNDNVTNLGTNPNNKYPINVVVDSQGNIYFTDQRKKNFIDILWKIDFKTNIVTNVIDNLGQPNTYFNVPSDIFYNTHFVSADVLRLTIDKAGNIYMYLLGYNYLGLNSIIRSYYIIKIEANTGKLTVVLTR